MQTEQIEDEPTLRHCKFCSQGYLHLVSGINKCPICYGTGHIIDLRRYPRNTGFLKSLINSLKCKKGHTITESDKMAISTSYVIYTNCTTCHQHVKLIHYSSIPKFTIENIHHDN